VGSEKCAHQVDDLSLSSLAAIADGDSLEAVGAIIPLLDGDEQFSLCSGHVPKV
jgi:hypothetical protein